LWCETTYNNVEFCLHCTDERRYMWHLVMKSLVRNKRRTLLTGSGVAISLFLPLLLAMVYTALGKRFQGIHASPSLMDAG
jgi:cell division protein FtsX